MENPKPQVKPFMLRQAQHERLNLMAVRLQRTQGRRYSYKTTCVVTKNIRYYRALRKGIIA